MQLKKLTEEQFRDEMLRKFPGIDLNAKVTMTTGNWMHLLLIVEELVEEIKRKEAFEAE